MTFQQIHEKVQNKQYKEVTSIFVKALKSADAFLTFLDIKVFSQIEERQLQIGQCMSDVITLAVQNPTEFRALFETLKIQYLSILKTHQQLTSHKLYISLLLYSFMCQFTQQPANLIEIGDYYFNFFNNQPPIEYCKIFGEMILFDYIDKKMFDRAYYLEKRTNQLGKLLERDGNQLVEMIVILLKLKQKYGENIDTQLDIVKLRFGESEVDKLMKMSLE